MCVHIDPFFPPSHSIRYHGKVKHEIAIINLKLFSLMKVNTLYCKSRCFRIEVEVEVEQHKDNKIQDSNLFNHKTNKYTNEK